jgi:hypothetical protein
MTLESVRNLFYGSSSRSFYPSCLPASSALAVTCCLENLALRQQLRVLRQRHPRPQLATPDKFFWVMLRRLWPGWKRALMLAQPETVIRWHREGFRLYWAW